VHKEAVHALWAASKSWRGVGMSQDRMPKSRLPLRARVLELHKQDIFTINSAPDQGLLHRRASSTSQCYHTRMKPVGRTTISMAIPLKNICCTACYTMYSCCYTAPHGQHAVHITNKLNNWSGIGVHTACRANTMAQSQARCNHQNLTDSNASKGLLTRHNV